MVEMLHKHNIYSSLHSLGMIFHRTVDNTIQMLPHGLKSLH